MPDQSSAATEHAILQEITAPLDRLPDDPLSLVEADFPTSLRGYDRDAVDDYVEHVRRLFSELQATRSPEAAVRRALQRVGDQISGILQRAHETAEQITVQSRTEAEDRVQGARREAEQMIGAAEQRVRELDAETDRIWLERQRIVADADDLSTRLKDVAELAGRRFPADDQARDQSAASGEPAPATVDEQPPEASPQPPAADEAQLLAGTPTEAGAPELYDRAEDETVGLADETAPLGEDETVGLGEDETAPLGEDETVPLGEDETVPLGEDETAPLKDPDATDVPGAAADDSTAVIPPSSQAAHRRREH